MKHRYHCSVCNQELRVSVHDITSSSAHRDGILLPYYCPNHGKTGSWKHSMDEFENTYRFALNILPLEESSAKHMVAMDFADMATSEDHENLANAWHTYFHRICGDGSFKSYAEQQRIRFMEFLKNVHSR